MQGATTNVTTLDDPSGPAGTCSLHDAITASNTKTATNGCRAGTGNDTIDFNVTGTIKLSTSEKDIWPDILGNLTIKGLSANPPSIVIDNHEQCRLKGMNPAQCNPILVVDPGLDPAGLTDNGGSTQTIALEPSSVAIDAIPQSACTYPAGTPNPCAQMSSIPGRLICDQRAESRPDPEDRPAGSCDIGAYEFQGAESPIDCSGAKASIPSLISVLAVFIPESVTGVSDPSGYKLTVTSVEQRKPRLTFPRCPNAIVRGTTTFVRATNQGSGNLLYSIGFEATDAKSSASCTGAVSVCVQTFANRGQPCSGSATYEATSCK